MISWPDNQDYQGTGVTIDRAQADVQKLLMVVNKVPASLDRGESRPASRRSAAAKWRGAAAPEEMMELASSGISYYATLVISHLALKQVAAHLMA